MRFNRSANVHSQCKMYAASQAYDAKHCCPRFGKSLQADVDLLYIGAAYPMALKCMESVGCKTSTLYSQLAKECMTVCHGRDDPRRTGISACFAEFSYAVHGIDRSVWWIILTIVCVLYTLIFS
jgi:hypothetical protein